MRRIKRTGGMAGTTTDERLPQVIHNLAPVPEAAEGEGRTLCCSVCMGGTSGSISGKKSG